MAARHFSIDGITVAMWSMLLAGVLAATGIEVSVKPLSGPEETGTLTALTNESVTLATPDGPKTFPIEEVLSVKPTSVPEKPATKS